MRRTEGQRELCLNAQGGCHNQEVVNKHMGRVGCSDSVRERVGCFFFISVKV